MLFLYRQATLTLKVTPSAFDHHSISLFVIVVLLRANFPDHFGHESPQLALPDE